MSLACAVLAFLTSLGLLFLSHLEHLYSIQPSFLLNFFLSLSLLFDIVRLRSLWLASYTVLAAIYTASIALKLAWFCLESRTKQECFIDKSVQYGDEEVCGLYSRTFFWWINPLFLLGFKKTLSVEELPRLDQTLSAHRLHHTFSRRWASGKWLHANMDINWFCLTFTSFKKWTKCLSIVYCVHFQNIHHIFVSVQIDDDWIELLTTIPYYTLD